MQQTHNSTPGLEQSIATDATGWQSLGHWNFYFIGKLLLFWAGLLQFNTFYNLLFAAALVVPLGFSWLNWIRRIIAFPVGVLLLYNDTWFPPIGRLLAQPEVMSFSFWYLLELAERFVNWSVVGVGFLALVAYLYLYPWLRFTALTWLLLISVGISQYAILPSWFTQPALATIAPTKRSAPPDSALKDPAQMKSVTPVVVSGGTAVVAGKPTDAMLNQKLDGFYKKEQTRRVTFPEKISGVPFDIVLISICSLAWSDLSEVGLTTHPLFKNFNVIFDNFSSSTSYSGPAILRLLRANCGQTPHAELYKQANEACYLFQTLNTLGFNSQAALNHNGKFQGFLDEIRTNGNLPVPFIPTNLRPTLTGFDGSPIWDDFTTLDNWWQQRKNSNSERVALLYNTITLHDGNREATADGKGRRAPFKSRAEKFLGEINEFLDALEKSGRRVMVVFVPEHGAALKGDRMQIAGMREVPTFDITHVPMGVRLIGTEDKSIVNPVHVKGPTSFLALSDLISRVLANNVFEESKIDWNALIDGLQETEPVNENEGTIVLRYQDSPLTRLGGRNWIEYPK